MDIESVFYDIVATLLKLDKDLIACNNLFQKKYLNFLSLRFSLHCLDLWHPNAIHDLKISGGIALVTNQEDSLNNCDVRIFMFSFNCLLM